MRPGAVERNPSEVRTKPVTIRKDYVFCTQSFSGKSDMAGKTLLFLAVLAVSVHSDPPLRFEEQYHVSFRKEMPGPKPISSAWLSPGVGDGFLLSTRTDAVRVPLHHIWLNAQADSQSIQDFPARDPDLPLDTNYGISRTRDRGFARLGIITGGPDSGTWSLTRCDSAGRKLWRTTFRTTASVWINGIAETSDFGFLLCGQEVYVDGYTVSNPDGMQAFLVRVDSRGRELWRKTYGEARYEDESFIRAEELPDGGFLAQGSARGFQTTYLVRTDAMGNILWSRKQGDLTDQMISLSGGKRLLWRGSKLFEVDSLGNEVWRQSMPDSWMQMSQWVETADKGLMGVGRYDAVFPSRSKPLVMKLDSLGQPVWAKSFGPTDQGLTSIVPTADGGFLATEDSTDKRNVILKSFLLKFDPLFRFEPAPATVPPGEPVTLHWSMLNDADTACDLVFRSQAFRDDSVLPSADSSLVYRRVHVAPHTLLRDSMVYAVPADWAPGTGFRYRGAFKINKSAGEYIQDLDFGVDYVSISLSPDKLLLRRLDTLKAFAVVRNESHAVTLRNLRFGVNVMREDSTLVPDSASTGSPYLMPVKTFTLLPGQADTVSIAIPIPANWDSKINFLQAHLQSRQMAGERMQRIRFVGE
jgi:hypothetical protein